VIETNIDEIGEYLDQRELYWSAHMIRRQGERGEPEGPEPTTYLGLAVAAPEVGGRFGVKPVVVGATEVPVALPASGPWASDPCGIEPPLGFSIEEVGALGGAGGGSTLTEHIDEPIRAGVETSVEVSRRSEERANGEQR
jgi:hypothetical protein